MKLSIIVAMDKRGLIGTGHGLPSLWSKYSSCG